jgi:hypothetical protein
MGNSGSGHAGYMPRNKEEQQILACVKARDIKGLDLIVEKKKPSVELLNSALHVVRDSRAGDCDQRSFFFSRPPRSGPLFDYE